MPLDLSGGRCKMILSEAVDIHAVMPAVFQPKQI
jgi:hypothetical protein